MADLLNFRPESFKKVVRYKRNKILITYNPETKLFDWQATVLTPRGLHGSASTAKYAETQATKAVQQFMAFHGLE